MQRIFLRFYVNERMRASQSREKENLIYGLVRRLALHCLPVRWYWQHVASSPNIPEEHRRMFFSISIAEAIARTDPNKRYNQRPCDTQGHAYV